MNTQHAHVNTAASDCDGPMYREYVVRMNTDEIAESQQEYNDFSDIVFRERVLGDMVSLTTMQEGQEGTLTWDMHGFSWSRPTDEGYEGGNVTWCDDDCEDAYSQRDVFAEMMGY